MRANPFGRVAHTNDMHGKCDRQRGRRRWGRNGGMEGWTESGSEGEESAIVLNKKGHRHGLDGNEEGWAGS